MLRDNSGEVHPAAASLCCVVPLASHDDADAIIAHYLALTEVLASHGWCVHILVCPLDERVNVNTVLAEFRKIGAQTTSLATMQFPRETTLDGPNLFPTLQMGDRVLHALFSLQAAHGFRLVEFVDRGGLGLRTIQAKRAGMGFSDVTLVVKMHGPTIWMDRQQRRWMEKWEDLAEAFTEQFAFENADRHVAISHSLAQDMRRMGWEATDVSSVADIGEKELNDVYRSWLNPRKGWVEAPLSDLPIVTVGVAHYNLGAYLPDVLASLAAQTYSNLEVIVVDDGSTDADSRRVFEAMKGRFPRFQFLSQANAGIGAARNRAVELARGEYFLPMDADNVAHPDMVSRLVSTMRRNPASAAATCYFLAFKENSHPASEDFLYSYRPLGGPRVLAALKNVYGDGNALFRIDVLREVGGFEIDRDSSWEDWEVFVKLANRGHAIEVVPGFLFYYRHRETGFSRTADGFNNHQRVLRQFANGSIVPAAESVLLWQAFAAFQRRLESLEDENRSLRTRLKSRRHRWVDWICTRVNK